MGFVKSTSSEVSPRATRRQMFRPSLAMPRILTLLPMHALLATAARVEPVSDHSCRLLLIRHGQTNFNAEGRLQGRLESELTELGHNQAHGVGEWLRDSGEAQTVRQSFVSPRKRTLQTLANIEAHAKLPQSLVRPGLREIELTVWEGQLKNALLNGEGQPDSERWERWEAHPDGFVFDEDGHSPLAHLKLRAAEEWQALLAATSSASTSLIVAHGAFNKVFILTALGLPVDDYGFRDVSQRFELGNCAAVELCWSAGDPHASAWRLRYPSETPWSTREQELEIRARDLRELAESEGKGEL